jgi:hypothetical protein
MIKGLAFNCIVVPNGRGERAGFQAISVSPADVAGANLLVTESASERAEHAAKTVSVRLVKNSGHPFHLTTPKALYPKVMKRHPGDFARAAGVNLLGRPRALIASAGARDRCVVVAGLR